MIIMRQIFILLSIFHSTRALSHAGHIEKLSNDLWITPRSVNDGRVELKEELATRETKESSRSVETSRRSLASPRFALFASGTITSEGVRSQRRKRDAATDDGAVTAAAGSVTYDAVAHENEESSKDRRIFSSSRHRGYVTTRYGKNQRHHNCKNRSVLRVGHRKRYTKKHKNNNKRRTRKKRKKKKNYKNKNMEHNEETRRTKPLKYHKSFQQLHKSHGNRNFDIQLFVGNRSLALFRQELAAATATNSADEGITSSKMLVDRLMSTSSKDIDDIVVHARLRRPADTSTRLKVPKISSKYKNKRTNRTTSIKEATMRTKTAHPERKRKKFATNLTLAKLTSVKNKSHDLDDTSSFNDHDSQKIGKNITNVGVEGWKDDFVNVNDTDSSGKMTPEKIRIMAKSADTGDEDFYVPIADDHSDIHESLVTTMLSRLFDKLENSTTLGKNLEMPRDLDEERINSLSNSSDDNNDDLCRKWLDSKDKLEKAFLGPLDYLPACPCQYPNGMFHEDKIWDKRQGKYFRWRDVVGENERLDVYKNGATFCVRSLHPRVIGNAAAQHCCYDGQRRLLTRGTSAGTPNFVSPEITSKFREKIDILPWTLCKGDFTRFNSVRMPNNDNRCKTNPEDEEYKSQMENTMKY